MQAFHPFHASCLIHWILLCESEMADLRNKTKVTRGRKGRSTLKNRISSIFCPECQGTGVAIKGEELEKPTIPLSEVPNGYLSLTSLWTYACIIILFVIRLRYLTIILSAIYCAYHLSRCFFISWKPLRQTRHGWKILKFLRNAPLDFISLLVVLKNLRLALHLSGLCSLRLSSF